MRLRPVHILLLAVLVLSGTFVATSINSRPARPTATYVGQETCMSSGCHADAEGHNYAGADAFRETMHYKIHQRPTPENVVIDRWFREERTLETVYGGYPFLIDLKKGEEADDYRIRLRFTGEHADSTEWMKVAYNYGGNGWLQRFLIELDGSYHPVPFQYALPHYRETHTDTGRVSYNNFDSWIRVDHDRETLAFLDRNSQEFFDGSWDAKCASCHVNGFDVEGLDVNGATRWHASWYGSDGSDSAAKDINIAIGCESCHGPGSEHVADPENAEYLDAIDPGRWDRTDTSVYWTDRKLDICNQCHNRHSSTERVHKYAYDDANGLPYLPGLELRDFVNEPVSGAEYWDAVSISKAHHQTGQDYWRSGHYANHVFSNGCVDCHSPHRNTDYPYQLDRNWYSLEAGEGCLASGCHNVFAATEMRDGVEYNLHTKHTQENSQCVNCHYTKVATITFVGTYEFSDHSDRVIRPKATLDGRFSTLAGVPNTCAFSCHRNGYGERNRPDAFDEHIAFKLSTGKIPSQAPDFGISDKILDFWKEQSDIALADTLWKTYQELYAEYLVSVRTGAASVSSAEITSVSPNPARDVARIEFSLPEAGTVRLEIYDTRGQFVRLISEGHHEAGTYRDQWEGINEVNQGVPSGMYYVRLSGEGFATGRTILLQR